MGDEAVSVLRAGPLAGLGLAVLPLAAPVAAEGDAKQAGTIVSALSGEALTAASVTVLTLFLIAVLLESALALLFNWRPFIETFNARATRPLVAFLVALLAVSVYHYDAVTALMDAVQHNPTPSPPGVLGRVLTAAILAGGSAGVNTMLVALGFREVKTPATFAPKVPPDQAWIAVQVNRQADQGDVFVHIGRPDPANPADGAGLPLAGVITPASAPQRRALWQFFLHQAGRFPAFGGYVVKAMEPCTVALLGPGAAPGGPTVLRTTSFTPAPGAIIDLTYNLEQTADRLGRNLMSAATSGDDLPSQPDRDPL
jgi:hypothetical protein